MRDNNTKKSKQPAYVGKPASVAGPAPDTMVFAVTPYFNAAPLVEGMLRRADVKVVRDFPSALAAYVKDGRAAAALVPVVDYLFDSELSMLDGPGVCASEKVRSVLMCCRLPVRNVRTVAADPASHTSNMLARLLLRARLGIDATVRPANRPLAADAEIVIGDRALRSPPSGRHVYDLATEWNRWTQLPFVFAVWACRTNSSRRNEVVRTICSSYETGSQSRENIIERYANRLALPATLCREYLTQCVHYDIREPERRAIRKFAQLLERYEVLPGTLSMENRR